MCKVCTTTFFGIFAFTIHFTRRHYRGEKTVEKIDEKTRRKYIKFLSIFLIKFKINFFLIINILYLDFFISDISIKYCNIPILFCALSMDGLKLHLYLFYFPDLCSKNVVPSLLQNLKHNLIHLYSCHIFPF